MRNLLTSADSQIFMLEQECEWHGKDAATIEGRLTISQWTTVTDSVKVVIATSDKDSDKYPDVAWGYVPKDVMIADLEAALSKLKKL